MRLQQLPVDKKRTVCVLIIEDEPMIALGFEDVLIDAGFQIAGVVGKLEKAMALIESGVCDAAIVDANLGGVSASPAAIALAEAWVLYLHEPVFRQERVF